jgi:AraC-like DNA-binding protein
MYDIDGDFGRVRSATPIVSQTFANVLNHFESAGWHQCNSKYRIKREAGHPRFLLFFTLSGEGILKIEDTVYSLTANTFAIVPPNKAHEYYTKENSLWEFYWIHPAGLNAEQILYFICSLGKLFPIEHMNKLAESIERMLYYSASVNSEIEISSILSQILYSLLSEICPFENNKTNEIVLTIKQYIEQNYKDKVSLKKISEKTYISVEHMIRIFKLQTGYTPYEYLQKYRINKACDLLQFTDKSVNEIAREVGFHQVSNFISQFKNMKKATPVSYRNNMI